ncbi:uncharacterized protein LOC131603867 [Vicia villosa]|uniref:uncharacterized protein LOC131603867 n=1 Tax=Vicia villosa TaxID=3911 RepID=UPI00273B3EED|nr:uncharacterized protein LOC131603867 [Vicia villosa]
MENKIPADYFANNCFFHIWSDYGIAIPTVTDLHAAAPNSIGTASSPNSDGSAAATTSFAPPTAPVAPGPAATLAHLLSQADLKLEQQDTAYWKQEEDGVFYVSSCYYVLSRRHIPFGPANRYDSVFEHIWKAEVPLKVKAFRLRSFLNKIPTKDLLLNRGILNSSSNLDCVLCEELNETLLHSFLLCRNVAIVWKEMAEWIGLNFNSIDDFKENFWYWSNFCRAKKVKRGIEGIVWLAIIWSIWLCRNDIVFNNSSWNSKDVEWSCKALIWRWSYIGKITHSNYNFYEFSNNSLFYLN